MSVLENFKNISRSPYGGRQGSNVIFFLQICNEVPGEKKRGGPVAPPTGDRPLSPTPGATGSPVSILQIGTIASVLFFFRKFTTVMPFFHMQFFICQIIMQLLISKGVVYLLLPSDNDGFTQKFLQYQCSKGAIMKLLILMEICSIIQVNTN